MRKTGQNERYDEQGEFCPVPTADVLSWESFVPLRTWLLADLVRRVTRGCHVLQEQAEEPEEEGRVACGDCRCGVGGGLTGGWREACWAWPGFETTRRAKLAARTASGRAGLAPHGGLAAGCRTEVWQRGPVGWVAAVPVGGSGAEILMHVDRLCCYG